MQHDQCRVQVPHTSSKKSDGLYYKQLYDKEQTAKARVASRKEELELMFRRGGAPFSFYEKDIQRIEEKKRRIDAHRKDRTRFQVWCASSCPGFTLNQCDCACVSNSEQKAKTASHSHVSTSSLINHKS